jgi:hypothetical protein
MIISEFAANVRNYSANGSTAGRRRVSGPAVPSTWEEEEEEEERRRGEGSHGTVQGRCPSYVGDQPRPIVTKGLEQSGDETNKSETGCRDYRGCLSQQGR